MTFFEHIKHHFFPYRYNNHRARALHPAVLFFYFAFFVVVQFTVPLLLKGRVQVLGYAINIEEEKLLEDTNQKRAENGLKPLKMNTQLSEAARSKAAYMFTHNFWAHNAPDGTTPWKFINDAKYDYMYAGENLARDFENSNEVIDAWMNSETHRANILQDKYQDVGFAVVDGTLNGETTTLVVQMFGTPTGVGTIPQVSGAKAAAPATNPEISVNVANSPNLSLAKFIFTKEFSLIFIGFLITLLVIDGFFIWRKKIIRISSHNLAHLLLLFSLCATITFLKSGSIL